MPAPSRPSSPLALAIVSKLPRRLAASLACAVFWCAPLAAQERIELPADDSFLDPAFEELYSIGGLAGDGWEAFGFVSEAGFDDDGNLYVLDASNARVVVVSPGGELVREFGRRGDGPGEFGQVGAFAVARDGQTIVFDRAKLAFQTFGPDGEFARASNMRRENEGPFSIVMFIGEMRIAGAADRLVPRGFWVIDVMGPAAPEPDEHRYVVRFDIAGEEVQLDTLAVAWMPKAEDSGVRVEESGARVTVSVMTSSTRIFEPELLIDVMPDGGFAFADSTTYAIHVADPSGAVSRILTRPFQPRRVTDRIRDAVRERQWNVTIQDMGGWVPSSQIQEFMQGVMVNVEFYPVVPVLSDLRTSWQGRLWVQRRAADASSQGPIDILSADGNYIGTFAENAVAMPLAFGPDGLAAFVEIDDLDVQTIVVKRLPQAMR